MLWANLGIYFLHLNSTEVRTTGQKREHIVLWAFCYLCTSTAVLARFLEHQRQERSSSYGRSDGRRGNECSKQFLLNHEDPQSQTDGLCWPSGFIQLPAATKNFKSGCVTMHVNVHEAVFRSCILTFHEDGNLVWDHFEGIRPQKDSININTLSMHTDVINRALVQIMFLLIKYKIHLTSLTWKVLVSMLFAILFLHICKEKWEKQWSNQQWDRNRQCNGQAIDSCQCKHQQSS